MPRTARVELDGGVQHVTLRGNRGQAIFRNDRDRSFFLQEFEITAQRYRWTWLAYCLMSNHCHLVIETPERTLGLGMRQLAGRYAQTFNRRHGTYGHLFQERYGSVLVESDVHFAQLLRYVALNPVTAGLCSDPAQWQWSSHRHMLNGGPGTANARARVETLLEAWGGRHGARYAKLFDPDGPLEAAFGAESPWEHRPQLDELLAIGTRDQAIRVARRHGYRLAEIAAALGIHESTVSRKLRRERG
jgi:REP element-mobilizing transposase RayT